nr:NADH-quinone oxidoreductase subunit H [Janibacter limosus]
MIVAVGWAVLAGILLCALAYVAVTLDAVLSARQLGVRGGWTAPLSRCCGCCGQRRRTTVAADTLLWRVGGAGMFIGAFLTVAVIPMGRWVLADPDVGIVWFNVVDVMVWAPVWLTGWGANSAHSLVGGYRFPGPWTGLRTAADVRPRSLRRSPPAARVSGTWWPPGTARGSWCGCRSPSSSTRWA